MRVPAGARFQLELVINFYDERDTSLLNLLLFAMGLLEGDYLGGQGTRGYGRVAFNALAADSEWFTDKKIDLPSWAEELPCTKARFGRYELVCWYSNRR